MRLDNAICETQAKGLTYVRHPVTWNGKPVRLTDHQHIILGLLLDADGEFVSRHDIGGALGIDGSGKSLDVQFHKMRAAFSAAGGARLFQAGWGKGWRWCPQFEGPSFDRKGNRAAHKIAHSDTQVPA